MEENKQSYTALILKILKYWYIYASVLTVFGAGAYAFLKYKQPSYKSSVTILIEDEKESKRLSEEAIFSDLGFGKIATNLRNEMSVLASSPILSQVVEKLNLQYRYYTINGWIKREIYKTSPVEVLSWAPHPGAYEGFYGVLTADQKGGYRLEIDDRSLGDNNVFFGEFGKGLQLPNGTVNLSNRASSSHFGEIGIQVMSKEEMAWYLIANLDIQMSHEKSSLILLSLKDACPQRIQDVLTSIVETYNQNSVDKKNQVFTNTIDLINTRIEMIVSELSAAEQDVENYKQRFSMTELSSEGTMLMTEVTNYNKQIAGTQLQLEILNGIEEFLEKNRNTFEFVPTNASLTDLTLTNQISSFNQLLGERERKRSDLGPAHPDLAVLEKQIRNLRETIMASLRSIKKDLNTALDANQGVRSNLQARMQTLPRRERELIEIERRKSIKENLYLYLLQKREESAISLAVTTPKSVVVEPAGLPYLPVSPNRMQIYITAMFLGFAIPSAIVFLLYFLDNRIRLEDDIEKATSVPVVAGIAQSGKNTRLVVREKSRSITTETFRMLRANLAYVGASGQEMKSILLTSGISGEGKSFIALNLGLIKALADKKVVILELDLRKPKQEIYGEAKNSETGVVNYLINPALVVDDIVMNSGAHPNLDIIRCGPKPPNPGELILSPRLRELVHVLRSRYDFIILDAPPVGLVADPLQMKDLADITLFVLRDGYSRKPELELVRDLAEKGKLPRMFVIFNGIKIGKRGNYSGSGYGYGYGYSYGNDHGYYTKEEESVFTRLKKKLFGHKKSEEESKFEKLIAEARMNGNGEKPNESPKGKPRHAHKAKRPAAFSQTHWKGSNR